MGRKIAEDPNKRQELDKIAIEFGPKECAYHMPEEITIAGPATPNVDCEDYALGTPGIRNYLPILFGEVSDPKEGDIVLYYSSEDKEYVHVGRFEKDGIVRSKWSEDGHVLRHPIDLVPLIYGDFYIIQRIPEQKLNTLRQPGFAKLLINSGFLDTYY